MRARETVEEIHDFQNRGGRQRFLLKKNIAYERTVFYSGGNEVLEMGYGQLATPILLLFPQPLISASKTNQFRFERLDRSNLAISSKLAADSSSASPGFECVNDL